MKKELPFHSSLAYNYDNVISLFGYLRPGSTHRHPLFTNSPWTIA